MKADAAGPACAAGLAYRRMREKSGGYLLLTKPKIAALVMMTGLAALMVEGSLRAEPLRAAGVLLGIFLSAGAANGLNQIWERDIDALMTRTRSRRPLPAGRVGVPGALCFSSACGVLGIWLLQTAGNTLAALLGTATILFYVLVYTIWLKRRTSLNIVIGGAAGAAAPLIAWAAGANRLGASALLMFLVIFLWSPPHFWALALWRKEEYARAGIPMLPVTAGEKKTCTQITLYVALLLPVTAYLGVCADLNWIFFLATTLLGILLTCKVIRLRRRGDRQSAQALFSYTIVYLTGVFALMLVPG